MANYDTHVCKCYLEDIADAVRSINGSENTYTLAELPAAIRALTLSTIEVAEDPEEWTYNGVNYVISSVDDVRYLTRVVEGSAERIAIPEQIKVRKRPGKKYYHVRKGQQCLVNVNLAGMEVVRQFGDASTEAITDYTVSPAVITSGGVHLITVSWSFMGFSYTDTFTVEVLDENETVMVDSRYLKALANAIRSVTGKARLYRVPEMVQAIRNFRYKKEPNMVEDIGRSYPYLEITRLPDITHYETYTGGTVALDYTGLIVSVVDEDGTRTDVTDQCTFLPAEGTVLTNAMQGLNLISASYITEDEYGQVALGASFEVNLAVTLGGEHGAPIKIRVNKRPSQRTFVIDDEELSVALDYTGLIVKAVYKDGFTRTITNQCLIDPADGSLVYEREGKSSWTQKCNVTWFDADTYKNFHTSFKLKIVDNNDDQSTTTETISWVDPEVTTYTDNGVQYGVYDDDTVEEAVDALKYDDLPMDIPQYYGNTYSVDFDLVMTGVNVKAHKGGAWSNVSPTYKLLPAAFKTNNSWDALTKTALPIRIFATYKGQSTFAVSKILPLITYFKKYAHCLILHISETIYYESGDIHREWSEYIGSTGTIQMTFEQFYNPLHDQDEYSMNATWNSSVSDTSARSVLRLLHGALYAQYNDANNNRMSSTRRALSHIMDGTSYRLDGSTYIFETEVDGAVTHTASVEIQYQRGVTWG